MLRTVNAQPTLWEAILPEMCLGMPAELEAVDRCSTTRASSSRSGRTSTLHLGRPSVPIETYLRLMFLKYRYRLGSSPCAERSPIRSRGSGSVGSRWARRCRTRPRLMKITTRCGSSAVDGLNEALLAKAQAAKVLKTNKVRADTTVVPANVAYPTDSGLLAKGVAKMAKSIEKLKGAGLASDQVAGPHPDDAGPGPVHRCQPAATQRGGKRRGHGHQRRHGPHRRGAVDEARQVAANARRALKHRCAAPGRLCSIAGDLEITAESGRPDRRTDRERLAWRSSRRSDQVGVAHDPDARPIRKGRLGKPVEFGYKA